MSPPARSLAATLSLACVLACEPQGESPSSGNGPPPPPPTSAVVAGALQSCDGATPALPAPPEDVDERVDGLLDTLAGARGRMRDIALEELTGLGDGVVETLEQRLSDRERTAGVRVAAAEALGRIGADGSRPAAEALLARLEGSRSALERESWLYAQCAWQLGRVGQGWVVPRLVLCLKYEPDYETVVWICDSLASYGILAGLDPLFVIYDNGNEDVRGRAQEVLMRLQGELGCEDWPELARRWLEGGPDLPPTPQDPAYDCEVWRTIAALAEWQLRGVDDARYVLARLGVREAGFLGEALSDENVYVRMHAAQCLERMGPRAAAAGPALMARLDDPQVGPQAATALGAVRHAPAEAALRERTQARWPLEMRVAAAGALNQLALANLDATLRPLLAEGEPVDLRCAAAKVLVTVAPADAPVADLAEALRLLAGWMVSGEVEPRGPEDALGLWLARRAETGDATAKAVLAEWSATPTEPEAELERQRRRSALFLERASELGL